MDDTATTLSLADTLVSRRGALKRLLAARLGSEEDAEDVLQELFLRLERAPDARAVHSAPAYIYRAAINLARDFRRDRERARLREAHWCDTYRVGVPSEPSADLPEPEAAIYAKQRLNAIAIALEDLSEQCRRVFVLHKFEQIAHAEIAQRLGISRSTVEKHMTTALKHLVRSVLGG